LPRGRREVGFPLLGVLGRREDKKRIEGGMASSSGEGGGSSSAGGGRVETASSSSITGDEVVAETLVDTLRVILDKWTSNRAAVMSGLESYCRRGGSIDPLMFQQLGMIMGDLGAVLPKTHRSSPSVSRSRPISMVQQEQRSSPPSPRPPPVSTTSRTYAVPPVGSIPPPQSPSSDISYSSISTPEEDRSPPRPRQTSNDPSPSSPPPQASEIDPQVESLLNRAKNLGRLSPRDREDIVNICKDSFRKPLPPEAQVMLARLSHRQLRRLPKSNLSNDDRLLVLRLEEVKRREAGVTGK